MGYMGLDTWQDVDDAADLLYVLKRTTKSCSIIAKALKEVGSEFNPPGCVNVALLLESKQISPNEIGKKNLLVLIDKLMNLVEQRHDDYHDQAYIRLYNVARRCLKEMKCK
jgi:hypothetical protein